MLHYLHHPHTCKHFDPWDVEFYYHCYRSGPWHLPLPGLNCYFLALVIAKHWSDIPLLCFDNHYLIQLNAAIFVSSSSCKIDQPGHLTSLIHIELHANVKLCSVFM